MKRQPGWFFVFVIASSATACASSVPYMPNMTTSGPSLSDQGLEVNIARASCYVNRSADMFLEGVDTDRLGLELKLQVKNDSRQVASFSEARLRLLDTAARSKRALSPDESEVVSIPPGETRQLPLRFMTSDDLSCHHGFELVLADSIELGLTPIALSPIHVVASR